MRENINSLIWNKTKTSDIPPTIEIVEYRFCLLICKLLQCYSNIVLFNLYEYFNKFE